MNPKAKGTANIQLKSEITHRIATPSKEICFSHYAEIVILEKSEKTKDCLPVCSAEILSYETGKQQRKNKHEREGEEDAQMGAANKRLKVRT